VAQGVGPKLNPVPRKEKKKKKGRKGKIKETADSSIVRVLGE
jgi:hypothetical protein